MTKHDADFELDANALAMIAAYRSAERVPTDARERVWGRVVADATVASPVAGTAVAAKWTVVLLAAAAAIAAVAVGVRVLTPADATADGVQAPYERAASEPSAVQHLAPPVPPTASRPSPAVTKAVAASQEAETVPVSEEPPAAAEPDPEHEPESDAPREGTTRRRARRNPDPSAAPTSAPAEPVDTLAAETRLLQQARAALRAGAPARALTILTDHERRFPSGALATERAALRVIALCNAGRTSEGARAADAFLRKHPRTALAERVRNACDKG